MKHNKLVSLDHSKRTTKRYRLIVNARKRSIIDSFVDLIRYSDRRISTIVDVTKIIFSNVDSNSFHLDWQNVFTVIRLSHQIRFRSSRKHHIKYLSNDRISNFVVKSEIRFLIINTRNILLIRESFEILSSFLANRLFFFINSIASVSSQKTSQYFVRKSFNRSSAFDIVIILLTRNLIRKRACWF